MTPPHVVEITAADTAPLRREVLRRGTPSDVIEFPGDTDPTTFHLGAIVDGQLVGVSTWLLNPDPPGAVLDGDTFDAARGQDVITVQLRGMATLDEYQGCGVGTRLVDDGLRRAREMGALVVWARARDTALGFYERAGFDVVGEGFVTSATQLPHHLVRKQIT